MQIDEKIRLMIERGREQDWKNIRVVIKPEAYEQLKQIAQDRIINHEEYETFEGCRVEVYDKIKGVDFYVSETLETPLQDAQPINIYS